MAYGVVVEEEMKALHADSCEGDCALSMIQCLDFIILYQELPPLVAFHVMRLISRLFEAL